MRRALVIGAVGVSAGKAVRRRLTGYDLRGKTALVTGGSRGLGFAIAGELVDEGARVVICARDPDSLERARARLAERGGDVRAIRCDVGDNGQVEAMISAIGHVDVLVNN